LLNLKGFFLVILLLFLFIFGGCAPLQRGGTPVLPPVEISGDFLHALQQRALQLNSITIEGRLKMRTKTKQLPSVKIKAWLHSRDNEVFLRIKGLAALGITVFDLLVRGDKCWIYLPRSRKTFEGKRFFTSYGSMDVTTATKIIEMLLNPWSPSLYCNMRQVVCPSSFKDEKDICFEAQFLKMPILFEYNNNLAPRRFLSKTLAVEFFTDTKSRSIYPKRIIFQLANPEISGELLILNARFDALSSDSPLFDQGPFRKRLLSVK